MIDPGLLHAFSDELSKLSFISGSVSKFTGKVVGKAMPAAKAAVQSSGKAPLRPSLRPGFRAAATRTPAVKPGNPFVAPTGPSPFSGAAAA